MSSRVGPGLVILILLLPVVVVALSVGHLGAVDWDELWWALKNTLWQASLSALASCALGLVLGFGLLKLPPRLAKFAQGCCLIPSFLPALFVILLMLIVLDPFPMGILGIVLVHTFMYSGLVAVQWKRTLEQQASGLIETAYVLGAGQLKIIYQLILFLRLRIFSLGFLIFSICFVSFAIPLAVGGGKGTTLELLIYEKIRSSSGPGEALSLSLIQALILFFISLVLRAESSNWEGRSARSSPHGLAWWPVAGVAAYVLLFLYGVVRIFISGIGMQGSDLLPVLITTVLVAVAVGFMLYLFCMFIALVWSRGLGLFLNGYISPSTTLVGLAVFLLRPESEGLQLVLYILAFCCLIMPPLYRSGLGHRLINLYPQTLIGWQLGGSRLFIFKRIIFPQVHSTACFIAGLGALWVAGDFTLAKIVFARDILLSQVVYGMLNGYHLNAASGTMLLTVFTGLAVFTLFVGMGNVLSSEFEKKLGGFFGGYSALGDP